MRRARRTVATVAFSLAATASAVGSASITAAADPASGALSTCRPSWNAVRTPAPEGPSGSLASAAAFSRSDAWAAGTTFTSPPSRPDRTLAEHWDGTAWTIVPTQDAGKRWSELSAIAGVSSNDLWAVGDSVSKSGAHVLIEHWDGAAWRILPAPDRRGYDSLLNGVWAGSPSDAWAVGFGFGRRATPLIEHWDGVAWAVVKGPNPPDGGALYAVTGTSADDVWAVGQSYLQAGQTTLVEHWDGTRWSIVPAPSPTRAFVYLEGVSALTPSDAWAVGWYQDGADVPIVLHWDGTAWTEVPGPPSASSDQLTGVSAASPADVWAVGGSFAHGRDDTLVEHWDGATWSKVTSRSSGKQTTYLQGVAALPDGSAMAVGAVGSARRGTAHPWSESICPIQVLDGAFEPSSSTARQGQSVAWHVGSEDTDGHTVTDASGMGLFDSGERSPGGSYAFAFDASGTYPYDDGRSGASGEIHVPIAAGPRSGTQTTRFVVTWATRSAEAPYLYDVQIRYCAAGRSCAPRFEDWQVGVSARKAMFDSSDPLWHGAGTYVFRARLRNASTMASSGWSPTRSISVR